MEITVLCRVVDNFGDIGVAWRMVKQLKIKLAEAEYKWAPNTIINLVVDDLNAFNKINSSVCVNEDLQDVEGIKVYKWTNEDFCYKAFSGKWEKLQVILELFQCGRPDWMEKILFEEGLEKAVHIVMIDYLTAEDYAESFHKLQSLTRSAKVQKVNFMPGFTDKTGGLLIDTGWENPIERNANGNILFFTYEGNWSPVLKGMEKACEESSCNGHILLAQGRGKQSVVESFSGFEKLSLEEMDFVDQSEWDEIMKASSVLFIRGEESMSRACLSGIPFVWHAYPQSDEYQLVKVRALLEKLRPYFTTDDFEVVEKLWVMINSPSNEYSDDLIEEYTYKFMILQGKLEKSFGEFANNLRKNGDLAVNLMTFLDKNIIMK